MQQELKFFKQNKNTIESFRTADEIIEFFSKNNIFIGKNFLKKLKLKYNFNNDTIKLSNSQLEEVAGGVRTMNPDNFERRGVPTNYAIAGIGYRRQIAGLPMQRTSTTEAVLLSGQSSPQTPSPEPSSPQQTIPPQTPGSAMHDGTPQQPRIMQTPNSVRMHDGTPQQLGIMRTPDSVRMHDGTPQQPRIMQTPNSARMVDVTPLKARMLQTPDSVRMHDGTPLQARSRRSSYMGDGTPLHNNHKNMGGKPHNNGNCGLNYINRVLKKNH